jgi:hypothetical protein
VTGADAAVSCAGGAGDFGPVEGVLLLAVGADVVGADASLSTASPFGAVGLGTCAALGAWVDAVVSGAGLVVGGGFVVVGPGFVVGTGLVVDGAAVVGADARVVGGAVTGFLGAAAAVPLHANVSASRADASPPAVRRCSMFLLPGRCFTLSDHTTTQSERCHILAPIVKK